MITKTELLELFDERVESLSVELALLSESGVQGEDERMELYTRLNELQVLRDMVLSDRI